MFDDLCHHHLLGWSLGTIFGMGILSRTYASWPLGFVLADWYCFYNSVVIRRFMGGNGANVVIFPDCIIPESSLHTVIAIHMRNTKSIFFLLREYYF